MNNISKLLQPEGDDYPEAAQKNLEDSRALMQSQRYDAAGYHAGYVMECILKTCIQLTQPPRKIHILNDLSQKAIQLASLPHNQTARYVPSNWNAGNYDVIKNWRETIRYRSAGYITQQQASRWVTEVNGFFKKTIITMRLDGVI